MKSRTRKLIIVLTPFALTGAAALFLGYLYYTADSAPPEDQDLEVVYTPVDPAENGFVQVSLVAGDVFWDFDSNTHERAVDMTMGKVWDEALAEEILSRNEEAFKALDDVLKYPSFQYPEEVSFETANPMPWKNLCDAASIRCASWFRSGRKRAALDGALDTATLGYRMQCGDGTLYHYIVGGLIRRSGLSVFDHMLPAVDLELEELDAYSLRFAGLQTDRSHVLRLIKEDYQSAKEVLLPLLDSVEHADWTSTLTRERVLVNVNRTLGLLAEHCRDLIKAVDRPRKDWPKAPVGRDTHFFFGLIPRKNAVGRQFLEMRASTGDTMYQFVSQDRWCISKSRLLLALTRFHKVTGALPESLDELVPDHISEIPPDPFDGQPIRYSRAKKIIYSVSRDLMDSGGGEGDLVCELPF